MRTVPTTKRALLVLSHAMERAFDEPSHDGPDRAAGLIVGLFQRREYFDVEAERYAALAAAGHTVVVGFSGSAADMPPKVTAVTFAPDDPLAAKWVLLMCRPSFATALVATDLRDLSMGEMTLQASRVFSARWTFHRELAVEEARSQLADLSHLLPPDLHARALAEVAGWNEPVTPQERQLAAAADHLVYSVEAGQRRLMRLRSQLDDTQSLAERDQLTGLHNRHFLERFLGGADRPADLMAVLVDVDKLKTVNDTHGHEAGDAVLSAIASALNAYTGDGDVVIRWGGDEFLVLVPGLTPEGAEAYGQGLVDAVKSSHPAAPWAALPLSVSIGISPTHRTPLPLGQLDKAMYDAKRSGKGHVVVSASSPGSPGECGSAGERGARIPGQETFEFADEGVDVRLGGVEGAHPAHFAGRRIPVVEPKGFP